MAEESHLVGYTKNVAALALQCPCEGGKAVCSSDKSKLLGGAEIGIIKIMEHCCFQSILIILIKYLSNHEQHKKRNLIPIDHSKDKNLRRFFNLPFISFNL